MLTLAAADTLAAGASAASQVTCTVFGMELNAGTEVYKVLDQRQLAAAPATIYTVPGSTTAFIKTIMVNNNDTVVRTFRMFRGGTANANALTPNFSLVPGGCAVYEDGIGWSFYNSAGQILQGYGTPAGTTLHNFGITGSLAETLDRCYCTETNTTICTTGQIFVQAIYLLAGMTVSYISASSATTAAGTPTNYVLALYDIARNLLASSANQTTTAWAANTMRTIAMGTPYVVPTTGLYYCMFAMVATTVMTVKGNTASTGGQLAGQAPVIKGLSSTTYATGTAPASLAAITAGTTSMWFAVT